MEIQRMGFGMPRHVSSTARHYQALFNYDISRVGDENSAIPGGQGRLVASLTHKVNGDGDRDTPSHY